MTDGFVGSSRAVTDAAGRRYAFADHHCFACGQTNPIGMRLHIELGNATARTEWTVGDDFVGWTDRAHGGILATLLDEVMAWAPSSFDAWAVTAAMDIRFRSPVSAGERLTARGWVTARRRRIFEVAGEVHAGDGRLVADGRGTYLGASPAEKRTLKERYGLRPELPAAGARE